MKTLSTDTLIRTAFSYIARYVGPGVDVEDVYVSAILLLEELVWQGYPPPHYVYVPDETLWRRMVREEGIEAVPVEFSGEAMQRLSDLSLFLGSLPEEHCAQLNEQECLEYGSYLYLEGFLRFLSGEKAPVEFPPVLKVLQRQDLDEAFKQTLRNRDRLVFSRTAAGLRKKV